MGRLDDTPLQDLQNQLEQIDGEVPTKRVLAAIARKQGETLERLAERHNVCEKTIRNWLDRFAEQPIEQAPYDEDRSGRPSELTDEEYGTFIADLHNSPTEYGYDRQAWFPALAHDHLKKTYGVEYSLRHLRRIMKAAGLSAMTARPRHYDADPEEEAEYREPVQKKS